MKNIFKGLCALIILSCASFLLCSCAPKDSGSNGSQQAPVTSSSPETPAVGNVATEADYTVEFAGAGAVTDNSGKKALAVFFDFTNNGNEAISPFMAIEYKAYQGKKELHTAFPEQDMPYYTNSSLRIRPGTALRCCALFEYIESDGNISVQISCWQNNSDIIASAEFDPLALSGEDSTYEIKQTENTDFSSSFKSEGSIGECYVSINSSKLVKSLDNGDCMRVYISFTNRSENPTSFSSDLICTAYQDNIQLENCLPQKRIAEDENDWVSVQPGDCETVSFVYKLRTDSAVEIEISDHFYASSLGMKFPCK